MLLQKGGRRNLLAALAVVPFGGLAYWLGRQQGYDDSEDEFAELPFDGGAAERYDRALSSTAALRHSESAHLQLSWRLWPAAAKVVFYDTKGSWRGELEPQKDREPVLVWTGSALFVVRSDGEPMGLLNATGSKDTVMLEGLEGEMYTIKLADASPVRLGADEDSNLAACGLGCWHWACLTGHAVQ